MNWADSGFQIGGMHWECSAFCTVCPVWTQKMTECTLPRLAEQHFKKGEWNLSFHVLKSIDKNYKLLPSPSDMIVLGDGFDMP